MRLPRRILVVLAVMLAAVAVAIAVRTLALDSPVALLDDDAVAPAPAFDLDAAARRVGEAVRFRTIRASEDAYAPEFERFHAWLASAYPAAHAEMQQEVVAGGTLVYTWAGSDASRPAMLLLAHHDVVPVSVGTDSQWSHPPYAGVVAEGAVWGRGTLDDKGSLVAIFEAIEALASDGFRPARTVIVVSGHDEETGGTGAAAAAQLLRSRGTELEFVLDEGLATVTDFPLLGRPVALVGVAEKGYGTLRITAPATGGHSSAPPSETGVEVLARAVLAITSRPFPMRFEGPAADMLRALAPHAPLAVRVAVANDWLFGPLLVRQLASTPAGAATLHTTIAPTMLRGSPQENVLPQDAAAWINYRIAPGHSASAVLAHARAATRSLTVDIGWERPPYEPSRVSSTGSDAFRLIATLASADGSVPVAPGLVTATTDSRSFADIARDVYRYQPIHASMREFEMIHGSDEHLTLENLERLVTFYARLVATAAR